MSSPEPVYQPGFEHVDTTVSAAVCFYGYYGRYYGQTEGERPSSCPLVLDAAHAPPLFLAHGDHDTYVSVEGARALAARLRRQSPSPVVYAELPGGQHGFDRFIEGIRRLFEPPEVSSIAVLVFGAVGLVANAIGIFVLTRGGRSSNVNMRAAFLEVLNDTLGSIAVLVSAGVIALTGWQRADAVASLFIAVLIIPRTLKLLRETVGVLLESSPPGLDLDDVRRHLMALPHVLEVHDLHASQITSGLPVLSAHVVVEDSCFHDGHAPQVLDQLQACVAEHFPVSVEHSTFQLEMASHAAHELAAHT
jgi:cobalt-zinc-cadmium efflux system protein